MSQPYASLLDNPVRGLLPLTDRSATYLRNTVEQIESEMARIGQAESHYKAEAAACRALLALLTETRDRYQRDLGDHATPIVQPQRWPIDPEASVGEPETCPPPCGQPMVWTEQYGFVHEQDGFWVTAGEWCAAKVSPDATHVIPAIEGELS